MLIVVNYHTKRMCVKKNTHKKNVKRNFEKVWGRIKKETDVKNLTQLAEIVGSTQQYVSKKKKLGEFPIKWAFLVAQKYNLSTDWIMTGQGPKSLTGETDEIYFSELVTWAKKTGRSENIDWVKNQIDQTFPMFKEWRIRKDKTENEYSKTPSSKIA